MSERAVPDVEGMATASAALNAAEAQAYPVAVADDVLEELRRRNSELAGVANAAVQQANEERAKSQQLSIDLDRVRSAADADRASLAQQVEKIRSDAVAAVATVQQQAKVAETAVVAASLAQRAVATLGKMITFAFDRAPVIGTLAGAYLLARNVLPDPGTTQLALLGVYGLIAVLPAVFLGVRRAQ